MGVLKPVVGAEKAPVPTNRSNGKQTAPTVRRTVNRLIERGNQSSTVKGWTLSDAATLGRFLQQISETQRENKELNRLQYELKTNATNDE